MSRLLFSQGQMIPAQTELNRIAQRRAADDLYVSTVAEAHFQQTPAKLYVAADGKDAASAADAELVEVARFR